MGDFLSRDQILASEVNTREVEAFGGTVCVKELDTLTMDRLMKRGAFEGGEFDFSKLDLAQIAADHIVDPDTFKPILSRKDVESLKRKGFGDLMNIVTAAMDAAGFDKDSDDEETPEKN